MPNLTVAVGRFVSIDKEKRFLEMRFQENDGLIGFYFSDTFDLSLLDSIKVGDLIAVRASFQQRGNKYCDLVVDRFSYVQGYNAGKEIK